MPYPTFNKYKVDVLWFRKQLERAGLSHNGFAALMGQDKGAMSRKLSGKQRITFPDAQAMAKLLGCPLADVTKAGKVPVTPLPAAPSTGSVDANGGIDAAFSIKPPVAGQRPDTAVDVPLPGMQDPMRMAISRTPTRLAELRTSVLGVVFLADGRKLLRIVRPGSIPGRYDLLPAMGLGERENDVEVTRLYPWTMA
jgi:transcriptional regulator with XRE-family HTH domain